MKHVYGKIKLLVDHECNVSMPDGSVNSFKGKRGQVIEVRAAYANHLVKDLRVAKIVKDQKPDPKKDAPENKGLQGPKGNK